MTALNDSLSALNAEEYYDSKTTTTQRSSVRNSHNFIKSVLIRQYVGTKQKILDLGCGQGGDLLKIKQSHPSLYVGVDIAQKAIQHAQERVRNIKMGCRCEFHCIDFTTTAWPHKDFDIVNCQFSIHFIFETPAKAEFVLNAIAKSLKPNGYFVGTVPHHPEHNTFDKIVVQLPDDTRPCKEYVVQMKDLIELCSRFGLAHVMSERFDAYFEQACHTESQLRLKMNATINPDPNNFVFVFQKK